MDACRQGNGSRVTAWRTQPSAASVSFSLLRARALSLSLFLLPSLLLSLAHSRSRAPGSRPGRDRFERSRRPSSARPRPDTASASHSLSLSISLKRAGRSSYPPSLSLAHSRSLSVRAEYSSAYIHTLSPSRIMSYPTHPTHSPSISYGSVVSIERAFHESSRPSPTAQTQRKMNAARASRQRDYRRELSRDSYLHRLWHTSLDVPPASPVSSPFSVLPLSRPRRLACRGYFLPNEFIPRISDCLSLPSRDTNEIAFAANFKLVKRTNDDARGASRASDVTRATRPASSTK